VYVKSIFKKQMTNPDIAGRPSYPNRNQSIQTKFSVQVYSSTALAPHLMLRRLKPFSVLLTLLMKPEFWNA
jgi:hypothetical protein